MPTVVRHTVGAQYPPTVVPSLGFAHHPRAFVSQMKAEGYQLVPFLQVTDSHMVEPDRPHSPFPGGDPVDLPQLPEPLCTH